MGAASDSAAPPAHSITGLCGDEAARWAQLSAESGSWRGVRWGRSVESVGGASVGGCTRLLVVAVLQRLRLHPLDRGRDLTAAALSVELSVELAVETLPVETCS